MYNGGQCAHGVGTKNTEKTRFLERLQSGIAPYTSMRAQWTGAAIGEEDLHRGKVNSAVGCGSSTQVRFEARVGVLA